MVTLTLLPAAAAAQTPTQTGPLPQDAGDESVQTLAQRSSPALAAWRAREAATARLTAQATAHAEQARQEAAALAAAAAGSARTAAGLVATVDPAAQQALVEAEASLRAATAKLPAPATLAPLTPLVPVAPLTSPDGAVDDVSTAGSAAADTLAEAEALQAAASDLFAQAMAAETLVADVSPVGSKESWQALDELEVSLTSLEEVVARLEGRPGPVAMAIAQDAELDAWANGAIPLSELCSPDIAPGTWLRCDAADALDALNAAYRADHGTDLVVNSGYRTFVEQALLRAELGSIAAPAGASNHGRGIAVDLAGMGGLGQFDAPGYLWMKANGPQFGWYHPAALGPGGNGPQEPWHWEFLPGLD